MNNSNFNLSRFVEAQNPVLDTVLQELKQGRKQTHWMWFVFPQLAGLGRSEIAQHYAIANTDEAQAYLQHAVLGVRLEQCIEAVLSCGESNLVRVFGGVDAMKFHSCLTLFATIAPQDELFKTALERFYNGEMDDATVRLL